jgi:signal transduction histidine kinase
VEYEERLKERIKELECLYAISTQISQSTDIATVSVSICKELELAFRFPELARACITISGNVFGNSQDQNIHAQIKQPIVFQEELIGNISVSYKGNNQKNSSFLIEEKKLLNKVAEEISFLYERLQRKKKEDELNEIVRRQERLTILGEMTAGIAHELNTPLGNMIGFSEFIINGTQEMTTKNDANKIKQSALHAREIVKKLMFFSCEVPQKLQAIKINRLLSEAIDLLSPLLKQSGVNVRFQKADNNPSAFIDKVQFTQVIFNLLNNAIQASKPGDTVDVALNSINDFINITIQDTGCGIPIAIQEKIFEPFFTNKATGTGNGLGLSVVHGIIKKHKGRIQFSSEEHIGTTFVVSIPQDL